MLASKLLMRTASRMPAVHIPSCHFHESRKSKISTPIESTKPTVVEGPAAPSASASPPRFLPLLISRFSTTAEVSVSKIFPAGFGWQTASCLAGASGFANDSLQFALLTGAGDSLGVFLGHSAYFAIKGSLGYSVNTRETVQTGLLLSVGAFASGTFWQPVVNLLQFADLSVPTVMAGTWVACAAAFFGGLRLGRVALSNMEYVDAPSPANARTDALLSAAIGGATGAFVGTDAVYRVEENFLLPFVGIMPGTPDLMGCALAGTSTTMGFCGAMTVMNVAVKEGKNWTD